MHAGASGSSAPYGLDILWREVDEVFCLTLRTRPERRAAAERQLATVGLAERVSFLVQDADVEDGKRGCFHAHQEAARVALSRGARRALIFEDDIHFLPSFTPFAAAQVARFVRTAQEPWHVFFLGHFPRRMELSAHAGVVKVSSMDAHAYIITETGMRDLSQLSYQGEQVDVHYHYQCVFSYALYPMGVVQRPEFSDTEKVQRADDWNADKHAREHALYRGCVGRQMLAHVTVGGGEFDPYVYSY